MPDCSLCYENITARAGAGNFQAAVLTGWKEKHLPAQMSSQRKGRSRGFFHPQQFHRASCKSPGFPPNSQNPSQGQAMAQHPQAQHHRAGVQDGWTEVPRLLSRDFSSLPCAGTPCNGRFMQGSCPWEKKICQENTKHLQKPILPQPKCLDVREQGLV